MEQVRSLLVSTQRFDVDGVVIC
jgi:hypothetical protein